MSLHAKATLHSQLCSLTLALSQLPLTKRKMSSARQPQAQNSDGFSTLRPSDDLVVTYELARSRTMAVTGSDKMAPILDNIFIQ